MEKIEIKKYVPIPEEPESKYEVPDFDKLIKELRDLEECPKMSEGEAIEILGEIRDYFIDLAKQNEIESESKEMYKFIYDKEKKLLEDVLEKVFSKLNNQGNFGWIDYVGKMVDLEKESIEDDKGLSCKINNGTIYAKYNNPGNKIILSRKAEGDCKPMMVLVDLMSKGYSKFNSAMHHEVIHAQQNEFRKDKFHSQKEKLRDIVLNIKIRLASDVQMEKIIENIHKKTKIVKDKNFLREVQAYAGTNMFTDFLKSASSFLDLLEYAEVVDSLKSKEIDKFICAYQGIRRLYALGLSDMEIAKLVKESDWRDEIIGYDKIEDKARKLSEEKGIEEEDVDNLVLAEDLKRKIYVLNFMQATQVEIRRILDNIKKGESA
jgi:hypothetical protein